MKAYIILDENDNAIESYASLHSAEERVKDLQKQFNKPYHITSCDCQED